MVALARRISFRALSRPHWGHGHPSLLHRMRVDGTIFRMEAAPTT